MSPHREPRNDWHDVEELTWGRGDQKVRVRYSIDGGSTYTVISTTEWPRTELPSRATDDRRDGPMLPRNRHERRAAEARARRRR